MVPVSPITANSVNPTESSQSNVSPAENVLRQIPSSGSLHSREEINYLTQTNRQIETQAQTQTRNPSDSDDEQEDQDFFKEMRGWLMIVAILAAGSTYQAGLKPPGGVWQDDREFVAGTPVLHDKFFRRYQAFFYCNAISFLSSLVIIIFLMNRTFYKDKKKIKVLEITMVLDLFSFMAAYAAGSCRKVTTSVYVFLLMGGVFVYVISFAKHYSVVKNIAELCTKPCMTLRNNDRPQRMNGIGA